MADPGVVLRESPAPGQQPAFPGQTDAPRAVEPSRYEIDVLAAGLERPWSLAFLPDGRFLVTERPGRMRIVAADGRVSAPVAGVPAVRAVMQGGLLDIALDPGFAANDLVYFTYFEPRGGDEAGIAVARARLDWHGGSPSLADVQVIFRAQPTARGDANVGARLLFGRDGLLYITIGDRLEMKDQAQQLDNHTGTLVRIRPDGSVPPDNPFIGVPGALPEIYATGLRDSEGIAWDADGTLWEVENGPKGGDELNRIRAGANYGWPVITYGRDYNDAPIGEGTAKDGLEQPVYYWDPSIAPSNLIVYSGALSSLWRGNIFVTALKGMCLVRLVMEDGKVAEEEQILGELKARIRDVREGPDGALYVLTDQADGRLVRVTPSGPELAQQSY